MIGDWFDLGMRWLAMVTFSGKFQNSNTSLEEIFETRETVKFAFLVTCMGFETEMPTVVLLWLKLVHVK